MENIQIKSAKVQKIGNSFFILVPMDYIKNELIDANQDYDVVIRKRKENDSFNNKGLHLDKTKVSELAIDAVMAQTKKSL